MEDEVTGLHSFLQSVGRERERERERKRKEAKDDDDFDASDFWKVLDDGIIIIVKVVVGGR